MIRLPRGRAEVYPRPRGGTRGVHLEAYPGHGLSPPTRGNRSCGRGRRPRDRSIPAHAGEPPLGARDAGKRRVYPRPRGGTTDMMMVFILYSGLSPPTRGNPTQIRSNRKPPGSIPAHAGEPQSPTVQPLMSSVYPRPRGGTMRPARSKRPRPGLSPPTRGNPSPSLVVGARQGSIPAHAGEPTEPRRARRPQAVYPRPRGGTLARLRVSRPPVGLSPPTRGNQRQPGRVVQPDRSIPAHAGEPQAGTLDRLDRAVYPRPRGGTPSQARP